VNFPFPNYENGDIFLSWGELAARAYAKSKPEVAVKYIRNILAKYEEDGLSFQRYLRKSQRGAGEDILAGNCMPVVGLYRDIYGIQPKHNRLYLEAHLTPELNGTRLRYQLRGQIYLIELDAGASRVTADDFGVVLAQPAALNVKGETLEYFPGTRSTPALSVTRSRRAPVALDVESWPDGPVGQRKWAESALERGVTARHQMSGLQPGVVYELRCDARKVGSFKADAAGSIEFKRTFNSTTPQQFELLIP
jgi:hypothetical protein